jgi:hypothetical protein
MRLIFKVAAGVFLGIMGVLLVLAIPKWREHSRATNAAQIIALLTPEQVISRCGKPTTDDDNDLSGGFRMRSIVYDPIVLNFLKSSAVPQWVYGGMGNGVGKIDDPVEQLKWLPCLSKK